MYQVGGAVMSRCRETASGMQQKQEWRLAHSQDEAPNKHFRK